MDGRKLREEIISRWTTLKQEREPFMDQWLEISRHVTPASGRYVDSNTKNQARERFNRIYNNTSLRAANICAAGMQSGMTDESTQWFALTTGDEKLDASYDVKVYLDECQRIMEMAFSKSNIYPAFQHCWREVATMGICANVILEDDEVGFYCVPLTIGEYAVAANYRGQVDTLYRMFTMTAAQLVGQYGLDVVGRNVKQAYDQKPDKTFRVLHAIEPRKVRERGKLDNKNMPFRSVVMLIDGVESGGGILEESGYNEFPAVVGRWGASATSVYSEESPGMIAIGDTKQMRHQYLQKGNALDYQVNPALLLPESAKDHELDFLPGGRSYVSNPTAADQVKPAFDVQIPLGDINADIMEAQNRINAAFYVDMFLMLAGRTKEMTAFEVAQRNEEKLVQLGPVFSRLNNEVLRGTIERVFNILQRAGQLPQPPQSLAGRPLNVEYTSMLAKAQRSIRAASLRNYLADLGMVAQMKPEILSKVNPFAIADEFADYHSVAPSVVVPTEDAQAQIAQQQQAMAQAEQQAQMAQGIDSLAKLGKIPAGNETMAGQAVQSMGEMLQQ
jgi:hypothetical protein